MPRAPKYETSVGPVQTSGARFRAADNNGGAFGGVADGLAGLAGATQRYGEVQDRINEQNDDTQARSILAEAQLAYGEATTEFGQLKAGAAREGQQGYAERLQKIREEALERTGNGRQRRMLEERIAGVHGTSLTTIGNHAVKEQQAERVGVFATSESSAISSAALSDNMEVADAFVSQAVGIRFDKLEQIDGYDRTNPDHAPIFETERLAVASAARGKQFDRLNADPGHGVEDTLAFVTAYEDEMTAELKSNILSSLKTPLQERSSRSLADEVFGLAVADVAPSDGEVVANVMPVAGTIPNGGRFTSERDGGARQHAALDISAAVGTPIYAMKPGKVTKVMPLDGASGNWVEVSHPDGTSSTYSHMNKFSVSVGDTVAAGGTLGEVGNTGVGTGPHLHLVTRDANGNRVDPETVLAGSSVYASAPREHDRATLYKRLEDIARERGLDPEEVERARGEIDKRINRDEGLKREQESDASEVASEIILAKGEGFTSTNMIPRDVWNRMTVGARAAATAAVERNTAAKGPEANSETYNQLRMLRAAGQLVTVNMAEFVGKITPSEFSTMVEAQVKESQSQGKWSPRTGISAAIDDGAFRGMMELTDREKVNIYEFIDARARIHYNKSGQPTPDDYDSWFKEATRETKISGGGLFGGIDSKPLYQTTVKNIEPAIKTRIETAIKKVKGANHEVTDDEVLKYYLRYMNPK